MEIRKPNDPPNADIMRDFVTSYLLDYNARSAVLRIGLNQTHCDHIAKEFMNDTFVLNEIKRQEAEAAELASNPDLIKSEVIKNLLSILKNDGEALKPSDRIASAKMLCDLLALAPKQTSNDNQMQTNVLIVPPSMDADAWSTIAMKSQEDLKLKLEQSL